MASARPETPRRVWVPISTGRSATSSACTTTGRDTCCTTSPHARPTIWRAPPRRARRADLISISTRSLGRTRQILAHRRTGRGSGTDAAGSGLLLNRANPSFPAQRNAWYIRDGFSECVELRLERGDPFQLDVLLVSHLDQEGFHPRETPRDWLHDGDYEGGNSSTTASLRF